MAARHFPVRPNLEQLRHQAKDLLRAIRRGEPAALAELGAHHTRRVEPGAAKLADAQLVLSRAYGLPSWRRLLFACRMTDAIWRDDRDAVRELVMKHPRLLAEDARGVKGNWGPPMSYAANLGRLEIVEMLEGLGAQDRNHAFERACLQGEIETAKRLYEMGARPAADVFMGLAETQNVACFEYLISLGAEIRDAAGNRLGPAGAVLETYVRNPRGKHAFLELLAAHGIALPDTAPMAVHRGRIDLLEDHCRRDPELLSRRFSHREIYPLEMGCHEDESLALHGTPIAGGTLLHLCVDYDEIEIARWLIAEGADVDAPALADAEGWGGHTPLFGCVVSQPYRVGRRKDDVFARLLLDRGANPSARASIRKRLRFAPDESMREYRDVTPLSWGERFHDQDWVSPAAMRLIAERGGRA